MANCVKGILIALFMASVISARAGAAQDGPNILQLGVGGFDLVGEERDGVEKNRSAAGLVELRFGDKLFHVGPALGVLANIDGGVYGYGGYTPICPSATSLSPPSGASAPITGATARI